MDIKLTPDQFTVLRTLIESEGEGLSQGEISRRMSSDPNTIASLVDRMLKQEVITRTRNPHDKRVKIIRITEKGEAQYEEARGMAVELQSRVLSALPEERREPFLRDLETISRSCQKALVESKTDNS